MEDTRIAPTRSAILAQVERIVASPDFDASERNRRFLRYVVDETLAGRGARIKAYPIAMAVFGRGEDFDSQIDPIVRIEARRLRSALERFYLLGGRDDAVRIAIPRGGYLPVFAWSPAAEGDAPATPARGAAEPSGRGVSVLVLPFEAGGEDVDAASLARGFARQLIVALTRFADLAVYGPATPGPDGPPTAADYVVSGEVRRGVDRFHADVLLTDARTGRHIWSRTFDRGLQPAPITDVRDEIAEIVAGAIAQPYGVIFASRVRGLEGKGAEQLGSYECVLRYYDYAARYDRAGHAEALRCLKRTVEREPDYAEALVCLALAYIDAFRYGYGAGDEPDPLGRAEALARRALQLAPHFSRCYDPLGLVLWFTGEIDAAFEALEAGLALNPNDTELMAHLGFRRCLRADWARGAPLIETAIERNPALPGSFRLGLALCHFAHGRHDAALAEARRLDAPGLIYGHAVTAITAHQAGRRREAADAIAAILAINPGYGARVADDLALRGVEPGLAAAIIAALRAAGLPPGGVRMPA